MRVLHVVTLASETGAFGGPTRVALNQAIELDRRGHEVTICGGWVGRGHPPTKLEGIPTVLFRAHRLMPHKGFSTLASPKLTSWLLRNCGSFEVVHIHAGRDFISTAALEVCRHVGVPYITQSHGMIASDGSLPVRFLDRFFTRRLLRGAKARFVLTSDEEAYLRELVGAASPLTRLTNGVLKQPIPDRAGTEPLQVLYMARLQNRKRPLTFVEMAKLLVEQGADARFCLVGPDEGCLSEVESFIADHHLAAYVHYEGALPYDAALARLAQADIYVLPSVNEPFPMSLLEALSLGIPSICTDSCGISEVLMKEGAAIVTAPTTEAVADAVKRLIGSSFERGALSLRARSASERLFSVESVADKLEIAYDLAVNSRPLG